MSMKNPLTPAGIELATFRFLAQYLSHCATAVPPLDGALHNLTNLLKNMNRKGSLDYVIAYIKFLCLQNTSIG